ncbi:MAG: hypothetical protein LBR26_01120 [Prevotella sp.]|jgi:hypothetical protein|nr:hypothetical protein [Prevotella sp.]
MHPIGGGYLSSVLFPSFDSDADKFYFFHTHMDTDALEEPNPTLYIGTLKK